MKNAKKKLKKKKKRKKQKTPIQTEKMKTTQRHTKNQK